MEWKLKWRMRAEAGAVRVSNGLRRACGLLLLAATVLPMASAQTAPITTLVDGVSRRLERINDLSAEFVQIYADPLNRRAEESGLLYLERPRKMRWEYETPEEKLFVTDGRMAYLYVPEERQVTRESINESFDDRIPIMFLLGRSNLVNEFSRIVLLNVEPKVPGASVLRMHPQRETDIEEVMLEVDPDTFDIRRLHLLYRDGSISDFLFSAIRTNTGLADSLFQFEPPPGVEVVEGIGR